MNKLFTFTVAACGAVSLIARTSEVFHVYRKIGAGANVIYSPVMNGAAKAELSSENPVIKVLVQGEYSVMSAEGYMCPDNVAGFFTYVEDAGHVHGHGDHIHHHHHQPHPLPTNIALNVVQGVPDSIGNPTYTLAIQQNGVTVGTSLPLQAMLDATGDVIAYQLVPTP